MQYIKATPLTKNTNLNDVQQNHALFQEAHVSIEGQTVSLFLTWQSNTSFLYMIGISVALLLDADLDCSF